MDDWLPAASRVLGERLPIGGSAWREAGELLQRLARPVPPRRGDPEVRAGGPVQDVLLRTGDGLRLAAWYLPSGPGEPVVIHHHFGATRYDYLPVARFLREAGHPVMLVDARSHGHSEAGAALGLALAERPADVIAAVGWLRIRGHRRFHGYGFSMGAGVTLMGASRCPGLLSLVLDSGPVVHLYRACRGIIDAQLPDAPVRRRRLAARRLYLDGRGWRYRFDLEHAAARLGSVPVLILHGDRDRVIPPGETELLRRRVLRGPCERVLLQGTAHVSGWALQRLRYRERVLDFLRGVEGSVRGAARSASASPG